MADEYDLRALFILVLGEHAPNHRPDAQDAPEIRGGFARRELFDVGIAGERGAPDRTGLWIC